MRTTKAVFAVAVLCSMFLAFQLGQGIVAHAQQSGTPVNCGLQNAVTMTAQSGNVRIITYAGSGMFARTAVCHASWSTDNAVNYKLVSGTGTNCGTGTVDATGVYSSSSGVVLGFGDMAPLRFPKDKDVCINFSGTVTGGGVVIYGQQ